ncbi:hypothetical protein [Mucilaginibacter dorajii]|uniref:HEAT repeat domain-containing protein n=1 Tax=Mucilaginibacter dorajii TaxID=692994 RepID=A0ABP7QYJ0_9SPHI|nr:hypothetical protein [Mucilaginibacter dorajii]MCS3732319.1 hypothetical protein [Mucilaginibacter dorajii]
MKSEKIEHLLIQYINGEISSADKAMLENLFEQDSMLKEKAAELATLWLSLDEVKTKSEPSPAMDADFYDMLQNVEVNQKHKNSLLLHNNLKSWLKIAATVIMCLTAFTVGRYTASNNPVYKYKTVFIKQPIPDSSFNPHGDSKRRQEALASAKPAPHRISKNKLSNRHPKLFQQLRSLYASDRIMTILKLKEKTHLNTGELRALELVLNEDPNEGIRLTALYTLKPMVSQPEVQQILIAALGHQDDEAIQTSIVDLLIAAKSKQAIPTMLAMLDKKSVNTITQEKIKTSIEAFLN